MRAPTQFDRLAGEQGEGGQFLGCLGSSPIPQRVWNSCALTCTRRVRSYILVGTITVLGSCRYARHGHQFNSNPKRDPRYSAGGALRTTKVPGSTDGLAGWPQGRGLDRSAERCVGTVRGPAAADLVGVAVHPPAQAVSETTFSVIAALLFLAGATAAACSGGPTVPDLMSGSAPKPLGVTSGSGAFTVLPALTQSG